MPRLPFDDPSDSPDTPTSRPADTPLSVSALCARLKRALGDAFPAKVRVVGEVSNFSGGRGGHWFFSLKDADATVRCVCFASVASRVPFDVADGMQVVATGRIDLYPAQGSVQLYIDKLEPVGQGALELALRQLIEELRGLGYFDPEHKRPLPVVPRRVAVVTSRSAAALADVTNTAHQRWPGCELLLYDVRVQGDDAAPQIAAALRNLSQHGPTLSIDAIILTRGGGSIEDLWAFNDHAVADAIHDCTIPLVAAVGHENDTTVAELVADLRCATPTQAAMAVVPDAAALAHHIDQLHSRLTLLTRRTAEYARQRLDAVARHALLTRPKRLVTQARDRLTPLTTRLDALPTQRLTRAQEQVDRLARHLDAVGPNQVLARGYTYTTDKDGQVLRTAKQATAAGELTTVFHDAEVRSNVNDGEHAASRRKPRRPRAPSKPNEDVGLFGDS